MIRGLMRRRERSHQIKRIIFRYREDCVLAVYNNRHRSLCSATSPRGTWRSKPTDWVSSTSSCVVLWPGSCPYTFSVVPTPVVVVVVHHHDRREDYDLRLLAAIWEND